MPIDQAILKSIRENDPSLTDFRVPNSKISDEDIKGLADALKYNRTLTSLNLLDIPIGAAGVTALLDALKVNTVLIRLELSYTQIKNQGMNALIDVSEKNTTLVSLFVEHLSNLALFIRINFHAISRNNHLTFILRESIKAALAQPIEAYSLDDHHAAMSKINEIFNKTNVAAEAFDSLIDSIFEVRLSDDDSEAELTEVVFKNIKAYIRSVGLDFERLPDTSYSKEFVRLLAGKVNAKNAADAESQVMALAALTQPFYDSDLRKEATMPLIGILNNDYFANLSKGSAQRRALDLLTLELGSQHPYERDLMGFALTSYARLCGEIMPRGEGLFHKLNHSDFAVADFENLLTKESECRGLSRQELREKCLEEFTRGFVPLPPRSLSPNPHSFYQPYLAIESSVSENYPPQSKRT